MIRFWHALGLRLCEVYGLSETTGVATVNPPDAIRAGTVGTALPGVEVRLSDAGEVLVRGPVVTSGYRHLAEAEQNRGAERQRFALHAVPAQPRPALTPLRRP